MQKRQQPGYDDVIGAATILPGYGHNPPPPRTKSPQKKSPRTESPLRKFQGGQNPPSYPYFFYLGFYL